MIHHVELLTRDGTRVGFPCADTQTVAQGAEAAGFVLPVVCREGGCGACRATGTGGDYELGEHSAAALPAEARARGEVLLCRTFPRGDLNLTASFDRSAIRDSRPPERRATIRELARAGEDVVRLLLRLVPDEAGGTAAEFEPGQYMELEIPGTGIRRAYSLANIGNWDGELEFLIGLHPDGRFSRYLREDARPGDVLTVHGPQGGFTLAENGLRPRWFVAGGCGLAPILSMLRRMADWQDPQPARLYFGAETEQRLFAAEALDQLAESLPGLRIIRCVRRPGPGWSGFEGSVVDAMRLDLVASSEAPDLYLCGPPAMIEAAEAAALASGMPEDRIRSERFPTR